MKISKLTFTRLYLGTVLLCMLALLAGVHIPYSALIVGLSVLVVIMGLPHGALDFAVAKSLSLFSSASSAAIFIVGYTLIAVFSIVFWVNFPATALVLFLVISVYHFSADWRSMLPKYAALSLATIVICGPAVVHSSTVIMLFNALMLSEASAATTTTGMRVGFLIALAGIVYFFVQITANRTPLTRVSRWSQAEWLTLVVSSVALTPLLHFGLYFCLLHSPKHLHDVSATLDISFKAAVVKSMPFVLLTVLIAVAVYVGGVSLDYSMSIDSVILRWLFIGLFGLTMSHMLLIDFWHQKRKA